MRFEIRTSCTGMAQRGNSQNQRAVSSTGRDGSNRVPADDRPERGGVSEVRRQSAPSGGRGVELGQQQPRRQAGAGVPTRVNFPDLASEKISIAKPSERTRTRPNGSVTRTVDKGYSWRCGHPRCARTDRRDNRRYMGVVEGGVENVVAAARTHVRQGHQSSDWPVDKKRRISGTSISSPPRLHTRASQPVPISPY
jgi:hypothetical protein